MIVKRIGAYTVRKDGTQYYRVFKGRKRIGSFLLLSQAESYMMDQLKLGADVK